MSKLREELSLLLPMLADDYISEIAENAYLVLSELVAIEKTTGSFEATKNPTAPSAFLRLELAFRSMGKVLQLLPCELRVKLYTARQELDSLKSVVQVWCEQHQFPRDSGLATLFRYLCWLATQNAEILLSPIERKYLELVAAHDDRSTVDRPAVFTHSMTADKLRRMYDFYRGRIFTNKFSIEEVTCGTFLTRLHKETGRRSTRKVRESMLGAQVESIRVAMRQQEYSQAEISRICCVPRSKVAQALTRPSLNMRIGLLTRIAAVLGIPVFGIDDRTKTTCQEPATVTTKSYAIDFEDIKNKFFPDLH